MTVIVQKIVLMSLVVAGLVALFQNCGSYTAVNHGTSLVYKMENGEQVESQALTPDAKRAICEKPENYSCVVHYYRPNSVDQQLESKVCHNSFCVPALVITHDVTTELAACDDCTAVDSQPGGRYFFDKAMCGNNMISRMGLTERVVESQNALAEEALAEALSMCLVTAE